MMQRPSQEKIGEVVVSFPRDWICLLLGDMIFLTLIFSCISWCCIRCWKFRRCDFAFSNPVWRVTRVQVSLSMTAHVGVLHKTNTSITFRCRYTSDGNLSLLKALTKECSWILIRLRIFLNPLVYGWLMRRLHGVTCYLERLSAMFKYYSLVE